MEENEEKFKKKISLEITGERNKKYKDLNILQASLFFFLKYFIR